MGSSRRNTPNRRTYWSLVPNSSLVILAAVKVEDRRLSKSLSVDLSL